MNLCASKPQAARGRRGSAMTSEDQRQRRSSVVRMAVYYTACDQLSERAQVARVPRDRRRCAAGSRAYRASAFRAASAAPRTARSFSSRRNGSRPRQPLPMCSWRSTRLPHGFFESFRWNTLMRSSPTSRSNSRNVVVVARLGAEIVAGGQQVTGVEADADARRAVERARGSPRGARSDVRGWCPAPPCARAGPSALARGRSRSSARERVGDQPQALCLACRSCTSPGCITSPSSPSDSARSSSSPSAAIDCARSAGAAAAMLIR